MAITIRRAIAADAEALAAFAEKTFRATYAEFNTAADMDQYIRESFSPAHQRRELEDPATAGIIPSGARDLNLSIGLCVSLLAEHDGTPVGYAQLGVGNRPPAAVDGSWAELRRLYVDLPWHGHGVAAELLARVCDEARAHGATRLWLAVWQRNHRAIRFYEKSGFQRIGETTFRLGRDTQQDWVMARTVTAP